MSLVPRCICPPFGVDSSCPRHGSPPPQSPVHALELAKERAAGIAEGRAQLAEQIEYVLRSAGGVTDLLNRISALLEAARTGAQPAPVCTDGPALDATDGAHPAWWRGSDYATDRVVEQLRRVLSGEDDGAGVCAHAGLEQLRRDLLALSRTIDETEMLLATRDAELDAELDEVDRLRAAKPAPRAACPACGITPTPGYLQHLQGCPIEPTGGDVEPAPRAAEVDAVRLRAVLELLSTLVYWHSQGHIDESWWDEARRALGEPDPGAEGGG